MCSTSCGSAALCCVCLFALIALLRTQSDALILVISILPQHCNSRYGDTIEQLNKLLNDRQQENSYTFFSCYAYFSNKPELYLPNFENLTAEGKTRLHQKYTTAIAACLRPSRK